MRLWHGLSLIPNRRFESPRKRELPTWHPGTNPILHYSPPASTTLPHPLLSRSTTLPIHYTTLPHPLHYSPAPLLYCSLFAAAMDESRANQLWRVEFRKRIWDAVASMQEHPWLSDAQSRHLRSFRQTVEKTPRLIHVLRQLDPFEVEVVSLASTAARLDQDKARLTPQEVRRALALGPVPRQSRMEMRLKISRHPHSELNALYREADRNGKNHTILLHRIQLTGIDILTERASDVVDWVTSTMGNRSIRRVVDCKLLYPVPGRLLLTPTVLTARLPPGDPTQGLPEDLDEHQGQAPGLLGDPNQHQEQAPGLLGDPNQHQGQAPGLPGVPTQHQEQEPLALFLPFVPGILGDRTDALHLLHIIHTLGGLVSACFFNRAYEWTESGEPKLVDTPVLGGEGDDGPLLAARDLLIADGALIQVNDAHGSKSFSISPAAGFSNWDMSADWKMESMAAVCRSFPRWPHVFAK